MNKNLKNVLKTALKHWLQMRILINKVRISANQGFHRHFGKVKSNLANKNFLISVLAIEAERKLGGIIINSNKKEFSSEMRFHKEVAFWAELNSIFIIRKSSNKVNKSYLLWIKILKIY